MTIFWSARFLRAERGRACVPACRLCRASCPDTVWTLFCVRRYVRTRLARAPTGCRVLRSSRGVRGRAGAAAPRDRVAHTLDAAGRGPRLSTHDGPGLAQCVARGRSRRPSTSGARTTSSRGCAASCAGSQGAWRPEASALSPLVLSFRRNIPLETVPEDTHIALMASPALFASVSMALLPHAVPLDARRLHAARPATCGHSFFWRKWFIRE